MDTLQIENNQTEHHSQQRMCQNCGEYVTKQFIRVFGTNDGSLYGV